MIKLPGFYTEEIWIRGGSIPQHKKYIGKYYISWSSCESFNDKAGFNTGLLGEYEYILNKFCKVQFPDKLNLRRYCNTISEYRFVCRFA